MEYVVFSFYVAPITDWKFKQTAVSISNIFVHWNDEIFPDPHTFKPERWLGKDEESLDMWLVSFAKGPRSCLGTKYVATCISHFPAVPPYTISDHF